MAYWLGSDTFADDPVWEVLAGGNGDVEDRLRSAYVRMCTKASHQLTNGYLTRQMALTYCRNRPAVLEKLTAAVLGRPPLLHRPGDDCQCLGDEWVDGYTYRIHNFLKRNPSRAEYERNKAQKADLRDARLKNDVYQRDGGCCRYCRSGPLSPKAGRARDRRKVLQYDHVDPDRAAEPDGRGLVVACAACNEYKGHRTPDEADMTLLDPPTPAQAAVWLTRDLVLNDRPTTPANQRPITDETATDHRSTTDPVTDAITDPVGDPVADPIDTTTGSMRPPYGDQRPEQRTRRSGKGAAMGRDGHPVVAVPTQPARSPAEPDIYHRRSRAPTSPHRPGPGEEKSSPGCGEETASE